MASALRISCRWVLAIGISLGTWASGLAAQTTRPASPATRPAGLDELISQLAADDFRARDAAQAKIVEMGPAAVAAMEELAARADAGPEVRQRAAAIVKQIGAADLERPTLVTLRFKRAPAGEVYAALFKQAGARLVTMPEDLFARAAAGGVAGRGGAAAPVTVDLVDVPFWTAMLELERQTGLWVGDWGGTLTLSDMNVRRGVGGRNVDFVKGPFFVSTDDFNAGGMLTRLNVYVEPKLRVVGHSRVADVREAVDAGGDPVERGMRGRMAGLRGRDRMMTDPRGGNVLDVMLDEPVMGAVRVSGVVRAAVLTREQTIEFDQIAKANNVRREADGRRVMLNAMNPSPGEWYITAVLYNTDPPNPGLTQTRFTLLDAKGNPLRSGGQGMRGGDKTAIFNIEFAEGGGAGPPATLRIVFPVETKEIEIPFEFKR